MSVSRYGLFFQVSCAVHSFKLAFLGPVRNSIWDLLDFFTCVFTTQLNKISVTFKSSLFPNIITVLHFTLKYEQCACPQTPPTVRGILTSFKYKNFKC